MLTKTLVRLFVPGAGEEPLSADTRYAYGRMAGFTGLFCNLLLFAIKLTAGLLSGSLAIVADAFNNLSDGGSVIVTLFGFKLAARPADQDHPFGHGRIEYLSALGVAVLIILAGFELATSAVDKILHPQAAEFSLLTMLILAASVSIKLWMSLFYRRIGTTIRSDALVASGVDSRNDVICTGLVLLTALISWKTGWMIDGYVGLAVALFVLWSGISMIRETVSPLLGQRPDPQLVKDIEQTVLSHEGVIGVHDVMVHDYGPGRVIVSLHAEVPASQDILVSHDVVDCIEQELMQQYRIISCIHMDPVSTDDAETQQYKCLAQQVLTELDERLSLHDFRVVRGASHTNLIFDVQVPFDMPKEQGLAEEIRSRIHAADERLYAVIKLENPYI